MPPPPRTSNPFKPGTGTKPLHVAGRKEELQVIEEALDVIARPLVKGRLPEAPLAPIKLIGLRGVGKTTLLAVALEKAQQQGIHVINYALLSNAAPGQGYDRMLASVQQTHETESTTSGGVNTGIKAERSVRKKKREDNFSMLLEERVREKPMLLLLDEAMHYEAVLLKTLLQETQRLLYANLPLAVIIAGTPMLDDILMRAEASFIDRAVNCPIHNLSDEEVREALLEPFTQRGVKMSEDALELLATWTDNYPYFVQLAGSKAWAAMVKAGRSEIDMEMAQQAAPAMQKARNGHYRLMFTRIKKAALLSHASHVITIIEAADQSLNSEEVCNQLAEAAGLEEARCQEVFDQLHDLGLIWATDEDEVIAGIPSFFSFFKARKQTTKA